ncbi:hypothetical protein HOC35_04765 [Candidatus Woesearchaeota archaeon]|jgi:hypothetical protein|nr:hypothetical protein [Candidatus Woesearchaeota archaeon]
MFELSSEDEAALKEASQKLSVLFKGILVEKDLRLVDIAKAMSREFTTFETTISYPHTVQGHRFRHDMPCSDNSHSFLSIISRSGKFYFVNHDLDSVPKLLYALDVAPDNEIIPVVKKSLELCYLGKYPHKPLPDDAFVYPPNSGIQYDEFKDRIYIIKAMTKLKNMLKKDDGLEDRVDLDLGENQSLEDFRKRVDWIYDLEKENVPLGELKKLYDKEKKKGQRDVVKERYLRLFRAKIKSLRQPYQTMNSDSQDQLLLDLDELVVKYSSLEK